VLTAVGGNTAVESAPMGPTRPAVAGKASFIVNGKGQVAEYLDADNALGSHLVEVRFDGHNRSCNKASCGACLCSWTENCIRATRWPPRRRAGVFTVQDDDGRRLHPLQRIGHTPPRSAGSARLDGWSPRRHCSMRPRTRRKSKSRERWPDISAGARRTRGSSGR
jgi:hypothetical protein